MYYALVPPSAASGRETGLESLLIAGPRQYTVCRCSKAELPRKAATLGRIKGTQRALSATAPG
jgi:hypothetical protein